MKLTVTHRYVHKIANQTFTLIFLISSIKTTNEAKQNLTDWIEAVQ